jgi:DNA-binding protein HU-beta
LTIVLLALSINALGEQSCPPSRLFRGCTELACIPEDDHSGIGSELRLIKLDIINEVVNKTGITKSKAEVAVEAVFETMKKALTRGDRIELRGFGVFNVRPRKTGIGRNPRTGAEVNIPPGKAVRFKPGKELQSID